MLKKTLLLLLLAILLVVGIVLFKTFKFSPMIDPIGFHGIDERVSLESYQTALWFYEQLLKDLN